MAGLLGLVAVIVPAGGWSAHLALSVRDHLEATRSALLQLRTLASTRDLEPMARMLADARWHAAEAKRLTAGPDWSVIAHAPMVGDGATTVRGLAESAAELTEVLAAVQRVGGALLPAKTHSSGGMTSVLDTLDAATPVLDDAVIRLARVRSRLAATPSDTGVDLLDQARGTALDGVDQLRGWLGSAATVTALLPPMLGHDGPRRYFMAFQTNAEARGTGGLVGAFGILRAGPGGIGITRLSDNKGLATSPAPVADHGADFRARYGPSAVRMLSISNLSPHFPYAAATWTGLWERQTHRRLDGAIAIDPIGLSYLLEAIGPVTLPGGERVTAENVVDLTERTAYARYTDPTVRKRFLITVAGAVSETLPKALAEPFRLLPALLHMVDERRIQIWSRRGAEQSLLSAADVGGVLPRRPGPFAGLVVNNSAGGKLDYYLKRSLDYELGPCWSGLRPTTVRVRLTNDVPDRSLPSYVTGRMDSLRLHHAVGSNLLWVSLYAGAGTKMRTARLDGDRVAVTREDERSHPVYSTLLEFAPGQSRTLEFDLLEPSSGRQPLVPVQPLVHPQHTRIVWNTQGCTR
ncbi:DUF4012 domain-containing protein [Streptosporangium sp. NBC_01756]|uniref:DUF4012 domain-containing protein n=1 Tax=Streptosporangium sp. NBC_01756 TaxID=2975950 RepID=UPI002DD90821|nr:DUF4012 domain-containing protein [Streptosporangium sp. NBC_01756]WSC87620.1 DUF4012 domain-containing protein [Streptosporangium sp. NBC_01756]